MTKSELFDLADLTGDAALVVRSDGAILHWSEQAERLFGVSRHRALGQRCFELLEGRTPAGDLFCSIDCPFLRGGARRQSFASVQLEVHGADKRSCWISLSTLQATLNSERAPVLLHVCHELEDDIRIAALAKRAYARLCELSSLLGETAPSGDTVNLSEREREVLRLASDGLTARQSADALGVAVSTVRNHIRNAVEKLGRHSKIGAVTEARKRGLL